MAHADYPDPILICSTTGTGVQPNILDASAFSVPRLPCVISIHISNTATVKVWASVRVSGTDPATLTRKIDISGGGFTLSDFYDLPQNGPRYFQIEVTANTGTVTVEACPGLVNGNVIGLPNLLRMTNVATQGM